MKTAEQIYHSNACFFLCEAATKLSLIKVIQEIQLEALKEGMRRAAKIASNECPVFTIHPLSQMNQREHTTEAILSAAEQITEKDL
jgi:hypothetical protein